jgi:hypothetical protein
MLGKAQQPRRRHDIQPPARLTAEEVAWVINCRPHEIPVLVAARLLKPLGNPAPNGIKFFATSELLEQVEDRAWLAKVTNALNQHWQKRNAAKKGGSMESVACKLLVGGGEVGCTNQQSYNHS